MSVLTSTRKQLQCQQEAKQIAVPSCDLGDAELKR